MSSPRQPKHNLDQLELDLFEQPTKKPKQVISKTDEPAPLEAFLDLTDVRIPERGLDSVFNDKLFSSNEDIDLNHIQTTPTQASQHNLETPFNHSETLFEINIEGMNYKFYTSNNELCMASAIKETGLTVFFKFTQADVKDNEIIIKDKRIGELLIKLKGRSHANFKNKLGFVSIQHKNKNKESEHYLIVISEVFNKLFTNPFQNKNTDYNHQSTLSSELSLPLPLQYNLALSPSRLFSHLATFYPPSDLNQQTNDPIHITIKKIPFILIEGNYWSLNNEGSAQGLQTYLNTIHAFNLITTVFGARRAFIPIKTFKDCYNKNSKFAELVAFDETIKKGKEISLFSTFTINGNTFTYDCETSNYSCPGNAKIAEQLNKQVNTRLRYHPTFLAMIENYFKLSNTENVTFCKDLIIISLSDLMKIALYIEGLITNTSAQNNYPLVIFELSPESNHPPVITYQSDFVKTNHPQTQFKLQNF